MNSIFYACPELSLGLERTSGIAEVVGSNLTSNCFFFQTGNIPIQNNVVFIVCLLMVRLSYHVVQLFFCSQFLM